MNNLTLKLGDHVLVSDKDSIVSRLIRRYQTSNSDKSKTIFSHYAMVIADNTNKVIEATAFGVKINKIDKYFKNYNILIARPKNLTIENKDKIHKKAMELKGKPYGYFKIVGCFVDNIISRIVDKDILFVRKLFRSDNLPICSLVGSYCYDTIGVRFKSLEPDYVQPDDIADEIIEINNTNYEIIYTNIDRQLPMGLRPIGLSSDAQRKS